MIFWHITRIKSPCITALNNSISKVRSWLLARGRSYSAESLFQECLARHGTKGELSCLFNPVCLFDSKACVPRNVVMVAIDMCRKSLITGRWIYGITWKHVYFNIFRFFVVDTNSVSKFVFPISYCFCLDDRLSGCVVAIFVAVINFFLFLLL